MKNQNDGLSLLRSKVSAMTVNEADTDILDDVLGNAVDAGTLTGNCIQEENSGFST